MLMRLEKLENLKFKFGLVVFAILLLLGAASNAQADEPVNGQIRFVNARQAYQQIQKRGREMKRPVFIESSRIQVGPVKHVDGEGLGYCSTAGTSQGKPSGVPLAPNSIHIYCL